MLKVCEESIYIIIKQFSNALSLLPNVLWDLITFYVTWKVEQNWYNLKILVFNDYLIMKQRNSIRASNKLGLPWNGLTSEKTRKFKTKTVSRIYFFLIFA